MEPDIRNGIPRYPIGADKRQNHHIILIARPKCLTPENRLLLSLFDILRDQDKQAVRNSVNVYDILLKYDRHFSTLLG